MNPHAEQPASPAAIFKSVCANRSLIMQMAWRDVAGRYRGSMMGLVWSFLNPVLMLVVYTFVFSVVFKAKWGGVDEGRVQFALVLFVGLIVHGLFAEVLNRSPSLIVGNVSYVKKVVFPLEILPFIALLSALFHTLVSVLVFLVAFAVMSGHLSWSMLLAPLVFFPLILLAVGLSWFLASLGVFVRDISQAIGIITTVMLFMAPVFFPLSALPESYHIYIMANPLTFIIEQAREVLVWGRMPDFVGLTAYCVVALLIFFGGFFWFQKTRKGFADVL